MPTTDSNLTGTFIANTYQKLLQTDSQFGNTGANVLFTQTNLVTTTKHSLLNGLGNKVQVIAIEGSDLGTGLFLKNTTLDSNSAWGISTLEADPANSNTDVGLSFWRPSPSSDSNLHKLFLKNSGTTWIGYEGPASGGGTGIVADVPDYSLYVKDGIYLGTGTTGESTKLRLDGPNYSEIATRDNFNFYMIDNTNPSTVYHPFRTLRYKYRADFNGDRTRTITDNDNTTFFSVNEWSAHVTGFYMNADTGTEDVEGLSAIMIESSGSWAIKFNIFCDDAKNKSFVIDVLLIRKGFYDDLRNLDSNQVNVGGSDLNPLTPLL